MKLLISIIMFAVITVATTVKAQNDLVDRVIQSEMPGAYNPTNSSESELNKAAILNSSLRLQYILLHETTNEELKVCYAIRVLDAQIAKTRQFASDPKYNAESLQKHLDELLKEQAELQNNFVRFKTGMSNQPHIKHIDIV